MKRILGGLMGTLMLKRVESPYLSWIEINIGPDCHFGDGPGVMGYFEEDQLRMFLDFSRLASLTNALMPPFS